MLLKTLRLAGLCALLPLMAVPATAGEVLDRVAAAAAVDAIFGVESGVILRALQAGGTVRIDGFGVFDVRMRAGRTGRNPSTGEAIRIPAHAAPAFRAGHGLKRGVRAG